MAKFGFLKETRKEMKHVVWPSRTRTIAYTVIILAFSLALGYGLSGVDSIFRSALRSII